MAKTTSKRRDHEVIDMAAEVFRQRGYANASVQDIADALGILKGSLYHYINTKEDLLFRILEEVHDGTDEILAEVIAVQDISPLDRLTLYVRRQVDFNARNLAKIAIYYNDLQELTGEHKAAILERRKAHERFMTKTIREAQEFGQADPTMEAHALSNLIFGTIIWMYRWYRPNGRLARDDLADLCARFSLNGVIGASPDVGA